MMAQRQTRRRIIAFKVFMLGMAPSLLRQKSEQRAAMKVFALGLLRFAPRDHRQRIMSRKVQLLGTMTRLVHWRDENARLERLRKAPKLKNLHWDTLTEEKAAGTVFHAAGKQKRPSITELFPDLEAKFASRPAKAAVNRVKKTAAATVQLLDAKTMQNMNISLARINKMPFPDLAERLEHCDLETLGGVETIDVLLKLDCFDPTVTRRVEEYKGSFDKLTPAERFVKQVVLGTFKLRSTRYGNNWGVKIGRQVEGRGVGCVARAASACPSH